MNNTLSYVLSLKLLYECIEGQTDGQYNLVCTYVNGGNKCKITVESGC